MSDQLLPTPDWPTYARQVIAYVARGVEPGRVVPPAGADRAHSGVFVTLHKLRRLRGCMGTLDPKLRLSEAVRHAAVCACAEDPRFRPVTPEELPELSVEVSILSPAQPMTSLDELELGRHGVIVQRGRRRGLFLPQVAVEHHLDKETLLARCCTEKAGLPASAWRDGRADVLLFTTEVHKG